MSLELGAGSQGMKLQLCQGLKKTPGVCVGDIISFLPLAASLFMEQGGGVLLGHRGFRGFAHWDATATGMCWDLWDADVSPPQLLGTVPSEMAAGVGRVLTPAQV